MLDVSIAPAPAPDAPFEDHVSWARSAPAAPATPATLLPDGLDATPVAGRLTEDRPPWDYTATAQELVSAARGPVLDIGTGDGTLFAGLRPPAGSAATESGHTFLAARRRLEPLGVDVRQVEAAAGEVLLPFFDARYAVALSRYGTIDPVEVARVLSPGGTFCTEQIDTRDGIGINRALGVPLPWDPDDVTVDVIADGLTAAGLEVLRTEEHAGARTFTDLGSLLWYLRVAAWQVPGLAGLTPSAVARHEAALRALHLRFAAGQELVDEAPRILVTARKPG